MQRPTTQRFLSTSTFEAVNAFGNPACARIAFANLGMKEAVLPKSRLTMQLGERPANRDASSAGERFDRRLMTNWLQTVTCFSSAAAYDTLRRR